MSLTRLCAHHLLAAAFVLATAPAAARAQTPALDRGSLRIAGTASLTVDDFDVGEDDAGDDATTVQLSPSLQYFVSPGLALGGTIRFSHSSSGEFKNTAFGIGPAATFYFIRHDGFHPSRPAP